MLDLLVAREVWKRRENKPLPDCQTGNKAEAGPLPPTGGITVSSVVSDNKLRSTRRLAGPHEKAPKRRHPSRTGGAVFQRRPPSAAADLRRRRSGVHAAPCA